MNMARRLKHLAAGEATLYGFWRILPWFLERSSARIRARSLGWHNGHVPSGSRVRGTRFITVGVNSFASGRVLLEAIAEYEGRVYSPRISIGNNVRTSEGLHVTAINSVRIGDDCLFGSGVFVGDHSHGGYRGNEQSTPDEAPARRELISHGAVEIGTRCWIGDNAVILGPVCIGDGVVVAANSVINRDVPAESIVAGAPGRVVRRYDRQTRTWKGLG